MADEVVLYHWPMTRGQIVHWMLEETTAPYRIEPVDVDKGANRQPAFLSINAMGKVPVIVHRGETITETGAIVTYLADEFPQNDLAPRPGSPGRGSYLRWMYFGAGCLDPALIDRLLQRPEVSFVRAIGYGRYENVLDLLEHTLRSSPYLIRNRFSAADLYIGSLLGFGLTMKSLEPRPLFQDYVERVTSRPAFKRVAQMNEQMMANSKVA